MPDITMCNSFNSDNEICSKRNSCYRFKASPTPQRQSYFITAPFESIPGLFDKNEVICEHYWKEEE
jgi:hypothetical protein